MQADVEGTFVKAGGHDVDCDAETDEDEPDGRDALVTLLRTALVPLGVEGHLSALLLVDDADALTVAQARQIPVGIRVNSLALPKAPIVVTHRLMRSDDRVVGRGATLQGEQS